MRVLQINAFHYLRGGVERSYYDTSRWLAAAGHEVLHFAMRDPRNWPSPTARHFAPPADYGEDAPRTLQLGQLPRALWSAPAARAMDQLLHDVRPDVAHVHAPSRYLTPAVLRPLERRGVPVVMTLHDFKPWCTNRVMFARGAACERCKGGRHYRAVTVACVQRSVLKSAVAATEAYLHQALGAYRAVRLWIAPSRFVLRKVVEHGLDESRVRVVPHGVETPASPRPGASPAPDARESAHSATLPSSPYALYAGRLSEEKGVRLLPAIALRLAPTPLVVAGHGPLEGWLEEQSAAVPTLLSTGHLDGAAFAAALAGAGVVVIPSLFYETFCYAAAEALAVARPVVASRIGAIPELVEHEITGQLVAPGDAHATAEAAGRALQGGRSAEWAEAGRRRVAEYCDPRRHLEALVRVYEEARS